MGREPCHGHDVHVLLRLILLAIPLLGHDGRHLHHVHVLRDHSASIGFLCASALACSFPGANHLTDGFANGYADGYADGCADAGTDTRLCSVRGCDLHLLPRRPLPDADARTDVFSDGDTDDLSAELTSDGDSDGDALDVFTADGHSADRIPDSEQQAHREAVAHAHAGVCAR